MPPDNKQKAELIENERRNLGIDELGKLGKKAAFATGGIKVLEEVAKAELKAAEVVENVAEKEKKKKIFEVGKKVIGAQALEAAGKTVEAVKKQTEDTAKETYNQMIQQRAEQEEKAKLKKKVTVKGPKKASVITDTATSVLKFSELPQFGLPFLTFADTVKNAFFKKNK